MTTEERSKALTHRAFEEMVDEGDSRRGLVFLKGVRCALLLVAGLLTGAIFEVWLMERSFRGDGSFYTELKQLQIQALTVPLPSLGTATLVGGLVHLFLARKNRLAAGLTLAGVLCFAVCFAITKWGHFPINAQIMGWSAEAPPDGWAELAAEWRRAHDLRTLFAVLGFGLLLLSATIPGERRGGLVRKTGGAGV